MLKTASFILSILLSAVSTCLCYKISSPRDPKPSLTTCLIMFDHDLQFLYHNIYILYRFSFVFTIFIIMTLILLCSSKWQGASGQKLINRFIRNS